MLIDRLPSHVALRQCSNRCVTYDAAIGVGRFILTTLAYDALLDSTASPIVAVNRALVVAELQGPRAGLESLEGIADERLTEYQPYWAARAELLSKTDQPAEARHAYEVAIGLERDPAVRRFLQDRQRAV